MNPAMMALMSGSGGRGGLNPMALGMAGADMGGMQDLLMMQALSGASGSGGTAGGLDPVTMMMLGGGAGGPSSDMLQQMMMMNLLRGNNQNGQGNSQAGQQQSMATNIANMLSGPAGSNTVITPSEHNALWGAVSMSGNAQRVMDAISSPTDRIALERDGLTGLNPMMTMSMCPRPTQCTFAFCENPEIPFTPETFYVCRGCPRCPMDPAQRNMMNMMSQMGGGTTGSRMTFP